MSDKSHNTPLDTLFDIVIWIVTFFYRKSYRRNTRIAAERILEELDDSQRAKLIEQFTRYKYRESQYVQVAGAVVFTSVVSCLQWSSVSRAHWSAAALFYCSIVFALVAVVMGAQQLMVLPDGRADSFDSDDLVRCLRAGPEDERATRVDKRILLALQCPMMLFTLSIWTFIAGLWSAVFSPLASPPDGWSSTADEHEWGPEAKTATLFGIVNVFILAVFLLGSEGLYLLPTEIKPLDKLQKNDDG